MDTANYPNTGKTWAPSICKNRSSSYTIAAAVLGAGSAVEGANRIHRAKSDSDLDLYVGADSQKGEYSATKQAV